MLNLLVIGHARHGKDTVCEILRDKYGYKFMSSSEYCAEHVVFPILGPIYGYHTWQDCFVDRSNHRAEWFNIIREYNGKNPARLGLEIFATYNIYCGLRNAEEMRALKLEKAYDVAIWVDASERVPAEDSSSNTITRDMADYSLSNNGTIEELQESIDVLMKHLSS